jgi:hypothetical protein
MYLTSWKFCDIGRISQSPQEGIRTVQEFLEHKDVKTMMIYTHVLNRGPVGVRSPVDEL